MDTIKLMLLKRFIYTSLKLSANDQDELENSWARTLQSLGFQRSNEQLINSVKDETDALWKQTVRVVRIGKVAPAMQKDFAYDQDCFYAEIELELAQGIRSKNELKFKDIQKSTRSERLTLLMIRILTTRAIPNCGRKNKSPFIKSINLLMYDEGKTFRNGKSLIAMSLKLLTKKKKTLEEKEITEVMDSLIKSSPERIQWPELRS
ncbi:hypothetical protein FQA39_LY18706 [Lamprigera yunnana]|nr:hypothetical protein FQA39_LY18706 [Lamprigera yunnana]